MKRSRNIGDLLEELIREILLRLPVKSLLRCKCVCKEWRALIGSRSFMDDHFNHESKKACLFIQPCFYEGSEFSMFTDDGRHLTIDIPSGSGNIICWDLLGPANGIFCAVDLEDINVVLFNPATRKLKPLPPSPLPLSEWEFRKYGFGFDPFSGDYKVVVFQRKMESQNFFLYNSSSDSWRKTEVVDSLNKKVSGADFDSNKHEVLLNGVYHWLMDSISILGFDMRSESFHEIPLPDAIIRDLDFIDVFMSAYGDSLSLVSNYAYVDGRFDLWVMGRDGMFSKSLSIALPQTCNMVMLCVWNKELWLERRTESETQRMSSALFKCDISTQEVTKLEPEFDNGFVFEVFSYKESLFSLEGERDMPDFVLDILELDDD